MRVLIKAAVPLGHTIIHTLGYADDVALTDLGDTGGNQRTAEMVSCVSEGSKKDADMRLRAGKTKKFIHVLCAQDPRLHYNNHPRSKKD